MANSACRDAPKCNRSFVAENKQELSYKSHSSYMSNMFLLSISLVSLAFCICLSFLSLCAVYIPKCLFISFSVSLSPCISVSFTIWFYPSVFWAFFLSPSLFSIFLLSPAQILAAWVSIEAEGCKLSRLPRWGTVRDHPWVAAEVFRALLIRLG